MINEKSLFILSLQLTEWNFFLIYLEILYVEVKVNTEVNISF